MTLSLPIDVGCRLPLGDGELDRAEQEQVHEVARRLVRVRLLHIRQVEPRVVGEKPHIAEV